MHFTLLVAGALIPGEVAVALSPSLDTPNLNARIARASLIDEASSLLTGNGHLDWLAHKLFSQPPPAPTGAYAYAHLSGATSPDFVWHADPVHMEVARDHLIVQALEIDQSTADDARHLIGVANELAADVGCEFVSAGGRWFLRSEHEWAINAAPLEAVVGAPMVTPLDGDAPIWNRLHNEIQMVWHTHPVNQAREVNRMRTINGLWLHGGGRWKPLPRIGYAQVQSDAPEWRGAAQAAGAHGMPLDANTTQSALLVVDDTLLPARLEDWGAWLRAMATIDRRLTPYTADAVDLVLAGSTVRTFASRPSDRYKPWRRRTLAEALTE